MLFEVLQKYVKFIKLIMLKTGHGKQNLVDATAVQR